MEYVNCMEFGDRANPAALILEGWGTNAELYRELAEHVAALGYRVLLPDLPGFGASPEPDCAWNCSDYAEFVNRFLEERDVTRVTLIGHSHGGRVIIRALGGRLLNAEVPRIVLIGSAGIVHERTAAQQRSLRRYKLASRLLRPFPRLLERLRQSRGSADYRAASPIMRQTLVKVINEDMREFLPNIAVPALLIWGENDTDTPLSDGRLMERLLPDGGLVVVPGAGHYAHLNNPAFVYRVLDSFLGGKH